MTRPTWDQYFLNVAAAVATRADCKRRRVGAVIWNFDHIIVGTGFNGVRAGAPGCLSGACPRGLLSYEQVKEFSDYNDPTSPGYCISSHAEQNALTHATGPLQVTAMSVTDKPCEGCRKAIYNAGLIRVIWPDGQYLF